MLVSVIMITPNVYDAQEISVQTEEAAMTEEDPTLITDESMLPEEEKLPSAEEVRPIAEDFRDLYAANPYTVGWLNAGAYIDYPVVHYDNDFYLHHDFYNRPDENGTLFVNEYNCMWPRDRMLLIHGHNMNSGAMFGTLLDYERYDYLEQYPLISFRTIYDEEDVYYTPIAAYNASMEEDNPAYFNVVWLLFGDEQEQTTEEETEELTEEEAGEETKDRSAEESNSESETLTEEMSEMNASQETKAEAPVVEILEADAQAEQEERYRERFDIYMDAVMERSRWICPVDYNVDDELLTLVTCSYYYENGRFMLLWRKLRENETPEDILALYPQPYIDEDPELVIDW